MTDSTDSCCKNHRFCSREADKLHLYMYNECPNLSNPHFHVAELHACLAMQSTLRKAAIGSTGDMTNTYEYVWRRVLPATAVEDGITTIGEDIIELDC